MGALAILDMMRISKDATLLRHGVLKRPAAGTMHRELNIDESVDAAIDLSGTGNAAVNDHVSHTSMETQSDVKPMQSEPHDGTSFLSPGSHMYQFLLCSR